MDPAVLPKSTNEAVTMAILLHCCSNINVEDSLSDILKGKSKAFFALRSQSRKEGRSQERLLATLWLWLQSVKARHEGSPGGSEQRPVMMLHCHQQ